MRDIPRRLSRKPFCGISIFKSCLKKIKWKVWHFLVTSDSRNSTLLNAVLARNTWSCFAVSWLSFFFISLSFFFEPKLKNGCVHTNAFNHS